ncbi:uncharacterized protein LOC135704903, partial [Ochlerotatus camptorhynchus]|uniref:uncharacterized protein LOC135704903 n=1 Tax=Ochlerotatus camptorhynchus TaxID=644619 RepID=UPI0031D6815C
MSEQPTMADLHKPSSNEFVSIADMILRQANTVAHANSLGNANVDNLFDLLSATNKNMVNYVDETATVASILSHAPLKKTQPINAETSEDDVFQSFLSITNNLKQEILSASTEEAANRITNDLFQKLGESEARRNTSSTDQLSSTDMLLNSENEEDYLEESNENDPDETKELNNFFKLCNKIGMDMYRSIRSIAEFQQSKSFVFSPFSAISLLSMLYLGARGKTADKINKLIGLDEMTSFNPHLTFKTISQAIEDENTNSYFVRMLFSDENRGKLQNFFKTKVTQLYSGYAEEISFDDRNMITNRINILVNNSTQGAQPKFLEEFEIQAAPPLCVISANSFE